MGSLNTTATHAQKKDDVPDAVTEEIEEKIHKDEMKEKKKKDTEKQKGEIHKAIKAALKELTTVKNDEKKAAAAAKVEKASEKA